MIAHLKDQLQEMKAKTSMEGKYIKKDAEVKCSALSLIIMITNSVSNCFVVQYFKNNKKKPACEQSGSSGWSISQFPWQSIPFEVSKT